MPRLISKGIAAVLLLLALFALGGLVAAHIAIRGERPAMPSPDEVRRWLRLLIQDHDLVVVPSHDLAHIESLTLAKFEAQN